MTPQDFLVEEDKALQVEIVEYQNAYRRLENFTFGGVLLVYGFFLTNLVKIPIAVWWVAPVLVAISATRCFAYYLILNRRFAPYLEKIEQEIYDGRKFGFQAYPNSFRIGRAHNLFFNGIGWLSLIGICATAAIWRSALDLSAVQL